MKYICVTGGVISGVGKSVIASSIAELFKGEGFNVTSITLDPYINNETVSPYERGEVYVVDDGIDMDTRNQEDFLNVSLRRDNYITLGKIYSEVIEKERRGDFLGKTVQVVPHIVDHIQDKIESVAKITLDGGIEEPQICIIEVRGTIGDIDLMSLVEALRQFQFRKNILDQSSFASVHVSLVPEPKSTGEQKSKPTQNSVKELRASGINPDLIVCRSTESISDAIRSKISMFCHVPASQVISVPNVPSISLVPAILKAHGCLDFLLQKLNLTSSGPASTKI